ncbi:MAG: YetF domain-containing protein [Sulfitobacter sp.]
MPTYLEITMRAAIVIAAILILTRFHGLRSFSKMSAFDFAITVSIGSVLASAVTTLDTGVWTFVGSIIALFLVQVCISQLRIRSDRVKEMVDNTPLLLMEDGKMNSANMRKAGVTTSDLWAKLREANAYNLDEVRAVIMETTGDVSVLHGSPDGSGISPEIMQDVRRS